MERDRRVARFRHRPGVLPDHLVSCSGVARFWRACALTGSASTFLTRQYNIRLEERVNERTRIAARPARHAAAEFSGGVLKFHAMLISFLMVPRPRQSLESVIEQAEAGDRRRTGRAAGPAVACFSRARPCRCHSFRCPRTFSRGRSENAPEFRVDVEGAPRELAPLVRDEVYRIVCEALRNAFRHSKARKIEVDLHFDASQLRLRVRDDGQGMTTSTLNQGARSGHYGLPGMHERAKLLSGTLAVWSEVGQGTEVELTIPASNATFRQDEWRSRRMKTPAIAPIALGLILLMPSALHPRWTHRSTSVNTRTSPGRSATVSSGRHLLDCADADGYLWLGTAFGLVRFDGVSRSVGTAGRPISPGSQVCDRCSRRTMELSGSAQLKVWRVGGTGKLTRYRKALHDFPSLFEDHEGSLWVGAGSVFPAGELCEIRNNARRVCNGEFGVFGRFGLYEDDNGNLWLGVSGGLWRWKPGLPNSFRSGESGGTSGLFETDNDGAADRHTRRNLEVYQGKIRDISVFRGEPRFNATCCRDRHGGLWIGSCNKGFDSCSPRVERMCFRMSDGLSGDCVVTDRSRTAKETSGSPP